jgi:hypothetical protein
MNRERWVISRSSGDSMQFYTEWQWVDDLQQAHVFTNAGDLEFNLAMLRDENKDRHVQSHKIRITLDY